MTKTNNSQSGNVFIIILVGVALFAALSFTIARGFRSDTTSQISERQAQLITQDILNYGQQVKRAVDKLRRKGCSESEISFDHDGLTIPTFYKDKYNNVNSPSDKSCHIFYPQGGNTAFRKEIASFDKITANPNSTLYNVYHFVRRGQVVGLGSWSKTELSLRILNVNESFCRAFNKVVLGSETIYTARMGGEADIFGGSFLGDNNNDSYMKPGYGNADNNAELAGKATACIESPDTPGSYSIYDVVFIR